MKECESVKQASSDTIQNSLHNTPVEYIINVTIFHCANTYCNTVFTITSHDIWTHREKTRLTNVAERYFRRTVRNEWTWFYCCLAAETLVNTARRPNDCIRREGRKTGTEVGGQWLTNRTFMQQPNRFILNVRVCACLRGLNTESLIYSAHKQTRQW